MFDFRKGTLRLGFYVLIATSFIAIQRDTPAQSPGPQASPAPAAISPEKLSASFAEVAKKVGAAVVSIDTKGKTPEVTTRGEAAPGDSDDIMDFSAGRCRDVHRIRSAADSSLTRSATS